MPNSCLLKNDFLSSVNKKKSFDNKVALTAITKVHVDVDL